MILPAQLVASNKQLKKEAEEVGIQRREGAKGYNLAPKKNRKKIKEGLQYNISSTRV